MSMSGSEKKDEALALGGTEVRPISSPSEKDPAMHDGVQLGSSANGDETINYSQPTKMTGRAQLLGTAICIGGFLFGYDIGVISGCLIMPDFVQRFGGKPDPVTGRLVLPSENQSIITSLLSAGTFFGALAQAPVSDRLGRRKSMVIWSVIFTIGAVIQTASIRSLAQITIGRFVAGLGVGALSGLTPLYLGETAPKHVRGTMIAGYQVMIITGIFLSYGIAWASQTRTDSGSWRIPVGFQMLWGIVMIILLSFLPESPRWRLQRGDVDSARRVMAQMRGTEVTRDANGQSKGDPWLETELAEMWDAIQLENETFKGRNYLTSYALCFSKEQQMWKRTINGMMLQALQQLNGQNFYYYYGPTFFQAAAIQLDSFQIQFILGAVSLVCTVPALISVEKVGRRKSLLIGALGEASCAFIVAFVGKLALAPTGTPADQLTSGEKSAGNAFIAFAMIHLAFYSVFWGPVPWVYLGESFPQHMRAKCISLGSASNWFWNFMLSYFSPKVADQYGPYIMLIFGGCLIFAFFYSFFFIPEVKGLTLEQVDEMYEARVPPWRSAAWTPSHGDRNRDTMGKGAKHVERA